LSNASSVGAGVIYDDKSSRWFEHLVDLLAKRRDVDIHP
jgi:hypothetical protein